MQRKILVLVMAFIMFFLTAKTQDNVGIGTTTPHSSALLDLTATNKGLLIPRVVLLAATNGVNPVNGPATGLLVYNTSGAMTPGFYYWDGTEWVLVGSGGAAPTCVTLDEAYNCNGAGAGREITANSGSVSIILPGASTGDVGLDVTSNKGTTALPSAGIQVANTQNGVGILSEITNTTNLYSAIQGLCYSSLTGSDLPSGVSGYHDGTGLGVGVWGETSTNSTSGRSYGVYGISSGTGNGFGGYFISNSYPGLFAETLNTGAAAAQFASSGVNPLNPALLTVGWAQIGCGNSGGSGGYDILMNNVAGESTIAPDLGGWGYVGAPSLEWWAIYTSNAVQVSRRESKRDINYFDENISDYIMADIEKMKPALYKYKTENDELVDGMEQKTRYNMHLGFILEETPDYIQDNSFSGIDLYALASLGISGVQHNRKSIVEIEQKLDEISVQITDFGITKISGNEITVTYKSDFHGITPVVNITPNSPVKNYYIKEQNDKGFTLAAENTTGFEFNWMAIANYTENNKEPEQEYSLDPALMSQLKVNEAKKEQIHRLLFRSQQTKLEIKGATGDSVKVNRFKTVR